MKDDDNTTKTLISVAGAVVDLFVAIILAGTLLYFLLVLMFGVESIGDLQKFASATRDIMISLIIIVGTIIIIFFLIQFLRWLSKNEDGIMILPFEVAAGEEKYSGKAVSHLLTAELLRIRRIHKIEYKGISLMSENVTVPHLAPVSEDLTYTVSQMGPVGLGTTSIHLGPLIVILKRLWPRGDSGQVISGSLQKYGSMTSLLACLEHQKIRVWEASKIEDGDQVGDEIIPALISDLAFKMVHDLSLEGNAAKKITAKTWQGFKHLTEALDAYHQYNLTDDMDYLERARMECLKAANSETGYEILLILLYNLGMAYTSKKEYFMAEELFLQAINIKSDSLFSLFGLGYLNDVQELGDKALGYFEKVLDLYPNVVLAWNGKGNALRNLGKTEEALECYGEGLALDPKNAGLWYNKGNVLSDLGRYKVALKCFDKALEIDPKYEDAWYNKGVTLRNLERHEEAIECFDEALKIDPQDAKAWHIKGVVALVNLERHEEAIECYDEALKIEPQKADAWYNKGFALGNLKRYEEELVCYDEALKIEPQKADAWYNKGFALGNLERYEEALKSFDKAVELDPDYVSAYISLARMYRKLGRNAESTEACKKARDLIKKESEYNRACFEAVCGSAERAIDLLRSALEKNQITPEMARQDPDFEFIRDDPGFQALLDEFSEGKESS